MVAYSAQSGIGILQLLATRPLLWIAAFSIIIVPIFFTLPHPSVPENVVSYAHKKFKFRDILDDVRNSTLGFEKLLVISLPDRSDKHDVWHLAAAASDLSLTWIDGVRGEDVTRKAIPAGWKMSESNATLGCYRGHLNAMQTIVAERLSSALIFEDDAEWDVTIKSQLTEFARGLHYLQDIPPPSLNATSNTTTNSKPLHSPYGDDWDVLWLGYCGAKSRSGNHHYYVTHNDPTVVPPLQRTEKGPNTRTLDDSAPPLQGSSTRVITEPYNIRCLFAYAVSQRGARRFLYNYSATSHAKTADVAVSEFCSNNVSGAKCYAPFPQLIDNYLAAGDGTQDSDRREFHNEARAKGTSRNIVFPMKTNLQTWVEGGTSYRSMWPNETLVESVEPEGVVLPQGRGMWLGEELFRTPEDY